MFPGAPWARKMIFFFPAERGTFDVMEGKNL